METFLNIQHAAKSNLISSIVSKSIEIYIEAEGSERILGDEATVLPSILLPVRRRTPRDSVADERPDSSATALAKVLRKHRQSTPALLKLVPFQAQSRFH